MPIRAQKTEGRMLVRPKHQHSASPGPQRTSTYRYRKLLWVGKEIRGKYCTVAWGKRLTLEKATLIAGKVGDLPETTDDKTGIMKGLISFAANFDPPRLRPILPVKPAAVIL